MITSDKANILDERTILISGPTLYVYKCLCVCVYAFFFFVFLFSTVLFVLYFTDRKSCATSSRKTAIYIRRCCAYFLPLQQCGTYLNVFFTTTIIRFVCMYRRINDKTIYSFTIATIGKTSVRLRCYLRLELWDQLKGSVKVGSSILLRHL